MLCPPPFSLCTVTFAPDSRWRVLIGPTTRAVEDQIARLVALCPSIAPANHCAGDGAPKWMARNWTYAARLQGSLVARGADYCGKSRKPTSISILDVELLARDQRN